MGIIRTTIPGFCAKLKIQSHGKMFIMILNLTAKLPLNFAQAAIAALLPLAVFV